MPSITLQIKDCSQCPHHYTSPYPTSDSFERPEYWWCKIVPDETTHTKFAKVAGYVEWNDKIEIPEWCPIVSIKYRKEKELERLEKELLVIKERILNIEELGGVAGEALRELEAEAQININMCKARIRTS